MEKYSYPTKSIIIHKPTMSPYNTNYRTNVSKK